MSLMGTALGILTTCSHNVFCGISSTETGKFICRKHDLPKGIFFYCPRVRSSVY